MRHSTIKRFLLAALLVLACLSAPQLPAQAPAGSGTPAAAQNKPDAAPQSNSNPFPEDTSNVPVMPSSTTPALSGGSDQGTDSGGIPLPGEDLDPVRSPDDPAPAAASGAQADSSSSLSGLDKLLPKPDDDQPGKKRKLAVQEPTHEESASEDISVGGYYLDTRNWKAALSRFESALVLDPENPEVYWGLAEADRHLGNLADARANYQKVAEYDPDSRHGKEARKALKEPEITNGKNAASSQPPATEALQQ